MLLIGLLAAALIACHVALPKTAMLSPTQPIVAMKTPTISPSPRSLYSSTSAFTSTPPGVATTMSTQGECTQTHGKTIEDEIYSLEFDKTIPITLYLPPCLDLQNSGNEKYATLYLLHGVGGDETQWINVGLAREMDAAIAAGSPPFIVVMPLLPELVRWPSDRNAIFFTEELIPYIDSHNPTYTDRQYRAIGGLSRGATWALRIGLSLSTSFGKIGLHSLPLYDDEVYFWTNILEEMSSTERPALFVDSGNNDKDLGAGGLLDSLLTQRKISHSWHMFNGYHNEAYWSEHLPIYLEWYAQGW